MDRMFESYRNDLTKLHERHGQIRFNVIEYKCKFPGIDPYDMARSLILDGYSVVFDDSSISYEENERKRARVHDLRGFEGRIK